MPFPSQPSPVSLRSPLDDWNQAPHDQAERLLLTLCGSHRWAATLAARRPFPSPEHLHHAAANLWFLLDEPDWLQAFACHPRIGAQAAGTPASPAFQAHSQAEQQATQASLDLTHAQLLADANRTYEQRFGFLYIVFANGRTAPELLALLEARLTHDRISELHEAAREQHRITSLRMTKWLTQLDAPTQS